MEQTSLIEALSGVNSLCQISSYAEINSLRGLKWMIWCYQMTYYEHHSWETHSHGRWTHLNH